MSYLVGLGLVHAHADKYKPRTDPVGQRTHLVQLQKPRARFQITVFNPEKYQTKITKSKPWKATNNSCNSDKFERHNNM